MRFSSLIVVASAGRAIVATLIPRQSNNTCFDFTKGGCVGRQADATKATTAIIHACEKVTSCTAGQTGHGRYTVTGIVKGFPYTATLYVGDQCGGVASWSTDACVYLFHRFVDERCEQAYPAGDDLYELGYIRALCDDSYVSFNYGG